jgi:hypothetical protein
VCGESALDFSFSHFQKRFSLLCESDIRARFILIFHHFALTLKVELYILMRGFASSHSGISVFSAHFSGGGN